MKISIIRFLVVIAFVFSFFSCQQKKKLKTNEAIRSQTEVTLDLVALFKQNKQGKDTIITVIDDPVYHKTKKYKAINAMYLLQNEADFSEIDIKKTKIVFECKDGYKPEMPLDLFLKARPYIAFQDMEAPKGANWETILKNGNQMDAAPFYLVYPKVSPEDNQYKWPYNLVKIKLEPLDNTREALFPKNNKKATIGYQLFQKHCTTCHALNGIGGTMGPELNYPKSVTEYWIEKQLVQYITNPAAFRHNVKMPALGITTNDSQEIVNYLKYMSENKIVNSN
ncbi:cytochrome c [Flavobacterium ovatum]|uniref:c-type cytochrome n=1 Tax=Flavobacterium ovatum TaxID=1928857 RepID=UPI0034505EF7